VKSCSITALSLNHLLGSVIQPAANLSMPVLFSALTQREKAVLQKEKKYVSCAYF